eukprot:GHVS01066249.1.p1 GENE.GHVS01066249.1~~GHVS01066249.1.p1  ORF type:complete len:103 (+),score=8.56 GHVS01066249.1:274-582(+)
MVNVKQNDILTIVYKTVGLMCGCVWCLHVSVVWVCLLFGCVWYKLFSTSLDRLGLPVSTVQLEETSECVTNTLHMSASSGMIGRGCLYNTCSRGAGRLAEGD